MPQPGAGFAPLAMTAHEGWTTASAGAGQGHRAPAERSQSLKHARPTAWKAVGQAAARLVAGPVLGSAAAAAAGRADAVAALAQHAVRPKRSCPAL